MRRLFKILLIVVAILLLIPVVLFLFAQTSPGRATIAGLIERSVSSETLSLSIGRIEGTVPSGLRIDKISLSDSQGEWLLVEGARLDWRPFSLLRRRVMVDLLSAEAVTLHRPPAASPDVEATAPQAWPPELSLPVQIDLARLQIDRLVYERGLAGRGVVATVTGSAALGSKADAWQANLSAERLDAGGGGLTLTARLEPEAPLGFSIDADFSESADGAVADLLSLPGRPPVRLTVNGDGTLDHWRGKANAVADGLFDLSLDVGSEARPSTDFFDITASATGKIEPAMAALAGPAAQLLSTWHSAKINAGLSSGGTVDDAHLTITADALTAMATGQVTDQSSKVDVSIETAPHQAWQSLVPDIVWQAARIDVSLAGQGGSLFSEPVPFGSQVGIDISGHAKGLSFGIPALDTLIGATPELAMSGDLGLDDGTITLTSLTAQTAGLNLTGDGSFSDWGRMGSARINAAMGDLSMVMPPLSGRLNLSAEASLENDLLAIDTKFGATAFTAGDSRLDALVGAAPSGLARISVSSGDLAIESASLSGALISASGDGVVRDGFLSAGGTVRFEDISVLSDQTVGALLVDISASGNTADPAIHLVLTGDGLVAAGYDIEAPRITADIGSLATAPSAAVNLEAVIAGLPLNGDAQITSPNSTDWLVEDLTLGFGGLQIDGTVAGSGALATGRITAQSADLSDLSDLSGLAGQSVAGSMTASLDLASKDDAQSIGATISTEGLRVGEAIIGGLDVDISLADQTLAGTIEATSVSAGTLEAGQARIDLSGALDALDVQLESSGDLAGQSLHASGQALIATGSEGLSVTVSQAQVDWAEIALALTQPVIVRTGLDGVELDGLRATLDEGSISADGVFGDKNDFHLTLSDIPIELIASLSEGPVPDGVINGSLDLTGSRANLDGQVQVVASQISLSSDVAPIDVTLGAQLAADRLTSDLSLVSGDTVRLDGHLEFALTPPADGSFPTLDFSAPLDGRVQGRLDLAYVGALVPAQIDRLAGIVEVNTNLAGTLDKPHAVGSATLSDGAVVQREIGFSLTSVAAQLAFEPERVVLQSLTGQFFEAGGLTAEASIDLSQRPVWPVSGTLEIAPSRVLDGDLATVDLQTKLTLSGVLNQAASLRGQVDITRAEIRIPDTLPPSVVELPVREKGVEPEQGDEDPNAPSPLLDSLALQIGISAPSQVFVRGRGIEAELGGKFDFAGTAAKPEVTGELTLRRGQLEVIAQRLTFERGIVDFDGAGLGDPHLDFLAGTTVGDTEAQVAVTGHVSAPEFAFVSDPPLPEDEVASLILFGQPSDELSPFQAIQLAAKVAELTGVASGPNLTEKLTNEIRDSLGLDELTIGDSGTGPSLSAGRYVSDKVFVGVDQGLGAGGQSNVSVEIEVDEHITIESDVGAQNAGQVGIKFRWEY